jgi:hypothetical protein
MKQFLITLITIFSTLTACAQHVEVLRDFAEGRFEKTWLDQAYAVAEFENEAAGVHLFTVSSPNSQLVHIRIDDLDLSQGSDVESLSTEDVAVSDLPHESYGREHSSTSLVGIRDSEGTVVPYIVSAVTATQSFKSDIEIRLYRLHEVIENINSSPVCSFRINSTSYWSVNSGVGTENGHFILQAYYAWGGGPEARCFDIRFTENQGEIEYSTVIVDMPEESSFKRRCKIFRTGDSNIISYNYSNNGLLYRMIIECYEDESISGSYQLDEVGDDNSYMSKYCIMKRLQADFPYIILDQVFLNNARQLRKQTFSSNGTEYILNSTSFLADDLETTPTFGHPRPTGFNAWSCPIYFSNGANMIVDVSDSGDTIEMIIQSNRTTYFTHNDVRLNWKVNFGEVDECELDHEVDVLLSSSSEYQNLHYGSSHLFHKYLPGDEGVSSTNIAPVHNGIPSLDYWIRHRLIEAIGCSDGEECENYGMKSPRSLEGLPGEDIFVSCSSRRLHLVGGTRIEGDDTRRKESHAMEASSDAEIILAGFYWLPGIEIWRRNSSMYELDEVHDVINLNYSEYGYFEPISETQLYPAPRVCDVEYCEGLNVFAVATGPSVSGHNPEPGTKYIGTIIIYDDLAEDRVKSIPITVDAMYTSNRYGGVGFVEGVSNLFYDTQNDRLLGTTIETHPDGGKHSSLVIIENLEGFLNEEIVPENAISLHDIIWPSEHATNYNVYDIVGVQGNRYALSAKKHANADCSGIFTIEVESSDSIERVSKVQVVKADGSLLSDYRCGQIEPYQSQLLFYSSSSVISNEAVGEHPGYVNMLSSISTEVLLSDEESPQSSFLSMSPYYSDDDYYVPIEGWRDGFDIDNDSGRLIFATQKRALQDGTRIPGRLCQLQFARFDYLVGSSPDCDFPSLAALQGELEYQAGFAPQLFPEEMTISILQADEPYDVSDLTVDFSGLPSNLQRLTIRGVQPSLTDPSEYVAAAPGTVVLDAGALFFEMILGDVRLFLENLTFQNIDESNANTSVFDLSGNDNRASNCQFLNIYPDGGSPNPNASLFFVEGIPSQPAFLLLEDCLFVNCQGGAAAILQSDDCDSQIENCTFYHCGSEDGSVPGINSIASFENNELTLLNSIFSDGDDDQVLFDGFITTVNYCVTDAVDWASGQAEITSGIGNTILQPSEMSDFVRFVDAENFDLRLRHDSQCLDIGDPNSDFLDFDLTQSDIGWAPSYGPMLLGQAVTELEPGWYDLEGSSCAIHCEVPAGTTIRVGGGKQLLLWGNPIVVGSADGPRTALVGKGDPDDELHAGQIKFGHSAERPIQLEGLLLNYPAYFEADDEFRLDFYMLSGLNLNAEQVSFQNYGDAELVFSHCSGTVEGLDVHLQLTSLSDEYEDWDVPKQLSFQESSVNVIDCHFGAVEDTVAWAVKIINTPVGPTPLISGNTFDFSPDPSYDFPAAHPLYITQAVVDMRENNFQDCTVAALMQLSSTIHMDEGAMNRFMGRGGDNAPFLAEALIKLEGLNYLDLYCGYNDFVSPEFGEDNGPDSLIAYDGFTSPVDPRSWRRNFWGFNCSDPIPNEILTPADTVGWAIPHWVTLESSLDGCARHYEDTCPFDEDTALLTLNAGKAAELAGDLASAHGHYRAVVLTYPTSKQANEATLKLKALGLEKYYGEVNFESARDDLFAANDSSLAYLVKHQPMLQECSGWCVEARWSDRQGALSTLDSMKAVETDPVDQQTIMLAILEIATYPIPGGTASAGGAAMANQAIQQSQATRNLLHYKFEEGASVDTESILPRSFQIANIYPNPFNPSTTVVLDVPADEMVDLRIYNLLGRQVATLISKEMTAGSHKVHFDGSPPMHQAFISPMLFPHRVQRLRKCSY